MGPRLGQVGRIAADSRSDIGTGLHVVGWLLGCSLAAALLGHDVSSGRLPTLTTAQQPHGTYSVMCVLLLRRVGKETARCRTLARLLCVAVQLLMLASFPAMAFCLHRALVWDPHRRGLGLVLI